MRDCDGQWVADMLGIPKQRVLEMAGDGRLPYDDTLGGPRFNLGEVDERIGTMDVAELREVFSA